MINTQDTYTFLFVSQLQEATHPEIDHPVVQPGVLVDSSSAFLRENKNISHQPKSSVDEIFNIGTFPVYLPGSSWQADMETKNKI